VHHALAAFARLRPAAGLRDWGAITISADRRCFMATARGRHGYTGQESLERADVGDDPPNPAMVELRPTPGWRFWLAIVLTGVGTGACAAALTLILQAVQHFVWPGPGATLLDAADTATPWRHILVLLGAGLATGAGQIILVRLTSGNGIDIAEAIWFSAGRLPALRTLGSAVLSVVVVGMGASLGREGAPKQAGAVIANVACDRFGLSDDQRKLLVACGAGADRLPDRQLPRLRYDVRSRPVLVGHDPVEASRRLGNRRPDRVRDLVVGRPDHLADTG